MMFKVEALIDLLYTEHAMRHFMYVQYNKHITSIKL